MKLRLPWTCHLLVWLSIILMIIHDTDADDKKQESESYWSDWQEVAPCSRTCGTGIQMKHRTCYSTGSDDWAKCEGPDKIYTSCNTKPCPESSLDFRLEQCQKYNNVGLNIPEDTVEEWVAYYGGSSKCELNCLLKGTKFYYTLAPKVVDGTPCDLGSKDICVDGMCQSVGCDNLLGSDKQVDSCGVCDGDGSTCDTYRGDLKTQGLKVGYNDVMILPAGTTSLTIQEHSHSHNYLALRNLHGEYYLNKDWQIQRSQDIHIGGTTFQYTRDGHRETLTADGPLEEPVYVVIIRQVGHGAMFQYTYSVPHELGNHRRVTTYNWEAGQWGECSQECAGGSQNRDVICTNSNGDQVDDDLCNPLYKLIETQECNPEPCDASWQTSDWQACSVTCGKGVQVRSVFCKQPHPKGIHAIVADSECTEPRPDYIQTCNDHIPCPKWIIDKWSRCNHICGPGQKLRSVTCQAQHHIPNAKSNILPDQRCSEAKPVTTEACNEGPCHGVEWIISDWSGCSGSCHQAIETRQVVCSSRSGKVQNDDMCDSARRPPSSRPCSHDDDTCEPKPQWHASQWSKCSARCGSGIQRRYVVCAEQDGDSLQTLPDSECDQHHKMTSEQNCNGTDCQGDWFTGPFGKCSAACGGGQRQRHVMCFVNGMSSEPSECDGNQRPDATEDCNLEACDDDDLIVIGGCKGTLYGCCPDGITSAEGKGFLGCPSQDRIPTGLCIEADFGCCFDGNTPAHGPFGYGCPDYTCRDTKYGCCSDGQTPANDPHGEGCPVYYSCDQTAFGCCPDGLNPANGFNDEGCEEFITTHCSNTIFGCCDDGITAAQGAGGLGCTLEGSGELAACEMSKYGCCFDGVTAARGAGGEGCNEIDCQGALYGCCPDGTTAASGPGFKGCAGVYVPVKPLCASSQYGCCPDGVTAASGVDQEGCKTESCDDSPYGCCPDKVTEAEGPDGLGCDMNVAQCGDTPYGCCPDYITPANGPDYEGCPGAFEGNCQNTLFGCCPDAITAAADLNGAGCPVIVGGCAGTRHGCCLDGVTAAHGPNYEECPGEAVESCDQSLYGCCPDGQRSADGPGYAGCDMTPMESSCDQTAYGCCLDGYSIATGPDFESCEDKELVMTCADAAYGCCPDGVTEARGPSNAGCPSTVAKGVTCGLQHDRGSCSNYSVQWHFDPSYGACKRFWYGGCDGNANRFETKELCKEQCVKPKGLERCYLPKSVGRCSATEEKYNYNYETGACEKFHYGGCMGNDNKFDDLEECVQACVVPHRTDACSQPVSTGPCRGRFRRWYFDKMSQTCRDFVFGGCLGNDNKFETKEDCEGRCLSPLNKVCGLGKDPGPCKGHFQRWFFNSETKRCENFIYGGCHGNGNRFSSQSECVNSCQDLNKIEKDICTMPQDPGPCKAYLERWYYNQNSGFCERFVYGGCQGNDNRFESELSCRQTCDAQEPTDVCSLSMDIGPCQGNEVRYYYDALAQGCRQMVYGGCDGNENNFQSMEECLKVCGGEAIIPTHPPTTSMITKTDQRHNKCHQPLDPGPCLQSMVRWYYNHHTHTCRRFDYGGCEGNQNRFLTVEHCINECGGRREVTPETTTPTTPQTRTTATTTTTASEDYTVADMCNLPYNPGPCYAYRSQWYYDAALKKCKQFLYGGCGGNNNRFESRGDCEQACSSTDVCAMPQDSGECLAYIPAWYFDKVSGGCEQFIYGGCGGNANRFTSHEQCMSKCGIILPEVTGLDICAQNADTGPCQAGFIKYHYSIEEGQCIRFTYGGCQGNNNNFDSKKECTEACPMEDICQLPQKTGKCRAMKTRFYYNPGTKRCMEFTYGGCDGNANRFLTLESCQRVCGDEMEQPIEHTPIPTRIAQTTPSATPVPSGPAVTRSGMSNVCQLRKDPGPCRGYNPVWYFEPNTRTCRRFLYGGCEGNGNKFDTRDQCQQTCLYTETTTTTVASTTTLFVEVETDDGYVPGSSGSEATDDTTDFDMCLGEKDEGEYCSGWEIKWHFDPRSANCRQFYYGGCKGNANRFSSQEDCMKTCVETEHVSSKGDCYLPPSKGPCFAQQQRWYYDIFDRKCKDFIYGGCIGNRNHFKTKTNCEMVCKYKNKGDCYLPPSKGPCFAQQQRWYYDNIDRKCKDFIYGGCQGNGNRYQTKEICEMVCKFKNKEPDVCSQPKQAGPCQAFTLRYYFDQTAGRCMSFQFGGCQGNKNNFANRKECYQQCSDHMIEEKKDKTKGDCRLPMEPGPCQADFTRFFYDTQTGLCRPFNYGGCQGNGNNFETQSNCYEMCSDTVTQDVRIYAPGDCYDPQDTGTCDDATPRWYFDNNRGDCQAFYYSGCEGNGNNFLHYEDCVAFCSKISETCGVLQCSLDCPFGFSRGPDGCPKCECQDPCLTHQCPSDQECRQEQVVCVREPCKPQIVCRPKPKSGECPTIETDNMAMCVTECQEDVDCRGDAKCCSNGCGLVCVVPYVPEDRPGYCPPLKIYTDIEPTLCNETCRFDSDCPGVSDKCCQHNCGSLCVPALPNPPECRKSVFGCCPDGETQAMGWNFIGCPEEAPRIEDGGSQDIVAVVGEQVVISCVSKGAPAPQTTWYKSRFPLEEDDSKRMIQQENGSLVIHSVQPQDSTTYTCRAFNNVGSATKTSTLLVQVPVVIAKISESKQVNPGDDIMLSCMASGNPTPEIRWLHGNKVILASDPRYFIDKDGTLMIERAVLSDDGEYMCEANNGIGEPVTASTHVNVLGPFMVNIAPHNMTVEVGLDLRLVCEVTGDLTDVSIQWIKDGFPLLEDGDDRIKVTPQGELLVEDMMKSDEGKYTCSGTRYDSEISKSTTIYTEGIQLPHDCSDKPWYANCQLIIEARMCRHAYFKVFCCKSCHEAGLLP